LDSLLELLDKLRSGSFLLPLLMDLLRNSPKVQNEVIVSQIVSTLPYSMQFPPQIYIQPTLEISLGDANQHNEVISCDNFVQLLESEKNALAFKEKEQKVEDEQKTNLNKGNMQLDPANHTMSNQPYHDRSISENLNNANSDFCKALKKQNVRTWLLSSAPGMGKSMLTQKIATELRINFPDHLIVSVNLHDYRDFFAKNRRSQITVNSFLRKAEKSPNCENMLEESKIVFVFDGFDEICPEQRTKVLKLIELIVGSKIPLWISTRPQEEEEIKRAFTGTFLGSINIKVLTKAEQLELIELNSNFSKSECLEFFDQIVQSGTADLMENPLHLTMISQLLDPKSVQQYKTKFDLYRKICRQKVLSSLPEATIEKEEEVHLLLARTATIFFTTRDYSVLSDEQINKMNKTGLVTIENDKSSAKFVHQTIPEFYLALHALEKTNDNFEEEIKLAEYFQCNENEAFPQTLLFIDSFCSNIQENIQELPLSLKKILQEIELKSLLEIFLVFCKGTPNLFDAFLINTKLEASDIKRVVTENLVKLLLESSKYNKEVALKVLNEANTTDALDKTDSLNTIVKLVVINNYTSLFTALNVNKRLTDVVKINTNTKQYSLLHIAAEENFDEMVKLLLESNANAMCVDKNGLTALHSATYNGHLECVKLLIEKDPTTINDITIDGLTILNIAAQNGHVQVVDFLINSGADFLIRNSVGWTALHSAAAEGHIGCVKLLTEKDPTTINEITNDGDTALYLAAQNGHFEIVIFLIKSEANLFITESYGWTVLHIAAANRHLECAKLLTETDPTTINKITNDGETALYLAAQNGHVEVVDFLIKSGADLSIRGKGAGWTVLYSAAANGRLGCVKLLTEKDPTTINEIKNSGSTALFITAWNGHVEVVDFLIKSGADLSIKNSDGWTALHSAAAKGHLECVKLLAQTDPTTINELTNKGSTALYLAAQIGLVEVVDLLIKLGADLLIRNSVGWTALHSAAFNGHLECVKLFTEKNPTTINEITNDGDTAVLLAAHNVHVDVVDFLIKSGADLSFREKRLGCTALHSAAAKGHLECAKLLTETDPTTINKITNDGETALYLAAQNGHIKVVDFLTKSGADLSIRDSDGWTALHSAAAERHLECVKLLTEKDPTTINEITNDGETALYLAAQNGHIKVVDFLTKSGADLLIRDSNGLTALHSAAAERHLECVKLLTEKFPTTINELTNKGATALYIAARNGHVEVVGFLINLGEDPMIKDES